MDFQEDYSGLKTLNLIEIEGTKNPNLNGSYSILNITPLGKEGIPLLLYCLLFHSRASYLGVGY
jgi:hypothetical protein